MAHNTSGLIKSRDLPPEERSRRASIAGSAPHPGRKRNKDLKAIANIINQANVKSKKTRKELLDLGIADEDLQNAAIVAAAVFRGAAAGNMQAVDKWEQLTAAKSKDGEADFAIPAKCIGKAFVDINRNIEPNHKYVFLGGRASTKSSYISMKVIELLKNNPDLHACVIRKVKGTLRDSVYAQLRWAIGELGIADEWTCTVSPLEIRNNVTGQRIYFRGLDDPLKLKSIKPEKGYIGILWIEERDQLNGPEEERSVEQSVLRGGDVSYEFCSYNPPKTSANWCNVQAGEDIPNRVLHISTYLDAPPEWLGQKFIDDAAHLQETNPDAYEHEYLGIANGEGGQVFQNIERRTITDEEINRMDTIYQGADWGYFPDPFAFVRLYYNPAREEIYLIDEIVVNKKTNAETAQMIKDKGYTDYAITCDSAEPKSTTDFRAAGLPARNAVKGPGSVDYGTKWLQGRHIIIDPARTPHACKEFVNYEYERDKDDNFVSGYPDADNHTIDATRYALESVWRKYWSHA